MAPFFSEMSYNKRKHLNPFSCDLIFCVCLLVVESATRRVFCLPGWTGIPHSGTCFKTFSNHDNYYKAITFCESLGATMIELKDCYKEKFITDADVGWLWLGIHASISNTPFVWNSEKTKAKHEHWNMYHPIEHRDNCAFKVNKWISAPCGATYVTACEKKAELDCPDGFYGKHCLPCSPYCDKPIQECDINNGSCLSGCVPGYTGERCDTACTAGTFGRLCLQKCSQHCAGSDGPCDNMDGTCVMGCDKGYEGAKCDKDCNPGKYGTNCTQKCSPHCAGQHKACDEGTGACILGCELGYQGELCDTVQYQILGVNLFIVVAMWVSFALVWLFLGFLILTLQTKCNKSDDRSDALASMRSSKSQRPSEALSQKEFPRLSLEPEDTDAQKRSSGVGSKGSNDTKDRSVESASRKSANPEDTKSLRTFSLKP